MLVLQEQCPGLLSLEMTNLLSLNPTFYPRFLQHFPLLVRVEVAGSLVEDPTLDTLGATCRQLREVTTTTTHHHHHTLPPPPLPHTTSATTINTTTSTTTS